MGGIAVIEASANVPATMEAPEAEREPKTIKGFAEAHHVRVRRDSCGDSVIPGRKTATDMPDRVEYRNHIYDHGDGRRLGLCLMFLTKRKWTNAKRKMAAAGFCLRQDGDTEGTALFDPADPAQARVAIRLARIKARRTLSDEQREAAMARLPANSPRIARSPL